MTDQAKFLNEHGWSVDCIAVQPGIERSVWSLVIQMDEGREQKRSLIFRSPDFDASDSVEAFQTETWISSFWVSPTETVYACDGFRLWTGRLGEEFIPVDGLSDRSILKIWGLDDADRFILGEDGLVLFSSGAEWRDISLPDRRRLVDIAGPSLDSIYAVGHGGAFCRLVDATWQVIDTGTTANIRALEVLSNGTVYACGERGIAFIFQDETVTFLDSLPDRYFGGVAQYKNKVYFGASGEGVDVLKDNTIEPFKENIFGQRLKANAAYLWSCGGNSIFRYDGKSWTGEDFI